MRKSNNSEGKSIVGFITTSQSNVQYNYTDTDINLNLSGCANGTRSFIQIVSLLTQQFEMEVDQTDYSLRLVLVLRLAAVVC